MWERAYIHLRFIGLWGILEKNSRETFQERCERGIRKAG
ncbi:MAG: hypothetical protein ACI883_001364 [Candidatus Azotimanducaceae bacterium]|jgi:hypothetical protein